MAPIDPKKHDTWDTGLFDKFDKAFDQFDKVFDAVDRGFDKVDDAFTKFDDVIWDTRTKKERIKEAQQRMRMAKERLRRDQHAERADHYWEVKRENTLRKNKKKRLSIMSKSGIGIGGIIFWCFIGYQIFGGDDDADNKGTAEKKSLETRVTETAKEVKTQFDGVVQKAKDEYAKTKTEGKDPDPIPVKEKDDPDDIYGSTDDKW